jgi:2-deoxy-D-gluconate 3-dehydrogenase
MTEKHSNERMPLLGKIAIVTGGSGFLGSQHCLALAEHGAHVVNFDINPSDGKPNSSISFIACDISDEEKVKCAVESVIKTKGKIDILVNNASVDHKVSSKLANNVFDYRF